MAEPARLLLHCRGTVQGVGFRPFVHRLAGELALVGEVENVAGAVRVDLQGERPALETFLGRLRSELPMPARLQPLQPRWLPPRAQPPSGLRIAAAAPRPLGAGLIAPALVADLAPCAACRAELADPANRRHRYPFISCSACGPRYAIATAEPFARAHTTLAAFPLCAACRREFADPADRRFHAETIGCPACGPRLELLATRATATSAAPDPSREPDQALDPIAAAAQLLLGGGILALQGVGGFQLLVDATQPAAVERLRRRKRRPAKPFALLVAEPDWLATAVEIGAAERRLLASAAAPIVLLRRRHDPAAAPVVAPQVAPGSPALGVMLPASPLHLLLARAVGRPLVATSGNPSGEPLAIDPLEARQRLGAIAAGFLVHNRPIARPLDDSLVQLIDGQPALLRRARGYAPAALELPAPPPADRTVLALGGDLKAAPALARAGGIWLAPFQGDLAGARQQQTVESGLEQLLQRLATDNQNNNGTGTGPALEALVADAHPGYVGRALAERLARRHGLPLHLVQHHGAHGLAVAAEHGLEGPLLVWAADGLGYGPGPGHQLWGGELLLLNAGAAAQRLACLRPFPLPGGERAMRESRRAALGLLLAVGPELVEHPGAAASRHAFDAAELRLLSAAVRSGCNAPLSSGLGRLFDAVASLLGVVQEQSFEGESGLLLQGLAQRWGEPQQLAPPLPAVPPLPVPSNALPLIPAPELPLGWLDWEPLLRQLLAARAAGVEAGPLAARFHAALVQGLVAAAGRAADLTGCRRVALAGGCFQNALLLEGCIAALRAAGLEPWWSWQLPCNDGGLALGQLWAVLKHRPITKSDPPDPPTSAFRTHVPGHARGDPGDQ